MRGMEVERKQGIQVAWKLANGDGLGCERVGD